MATAVNIITRVISTLVVQLQILVITTAQNYIITKSPKVGVAPPIKVKFLITIAPNMRLITIRGLSRSGSQEMRTPERIAWAATATGQGRTILSLGLRTFEEPLSSKLTIYLFSLG
jgi:hypothetical protein